MLLRHQKQRLVNTKSVASDRQRFQDPQRVKGKDPKGKGKGMESWTLDPSAKEGLALILTNIY